MPAEAYCVRCGEPLENRASPYPLEGRGYAAAPHEHLLTPRIISSIYPHLPRARMTSFRIALALGIVVVIVLSLFELFPLALVVSAVLLPFLTLLYLWEVDLYEDEPVTVLGFTALWGVAAGIGLGFATRAATSSTSLLTGRVSSHDLLWLGILLPLATFVLMLAGPLALLPYHRFNDVLDGVTFGGAAAVTLLCAEVVTNSADFLNGPLKADGNVSLWIARLLTLAVVVPVLAAAAVGAAAGAFWLRYRAPARDRKALGAFGSPLIALVLAAAAIVGASVAQLYLSPWWALAVTVALAVTALVPVRRVIHVGLLEEAAEVEIGLPMHCLNCGRDTPTHAFCVHCGIALRALPKTARGESQPPHVRQALVPAYFALAVAAAVGLAAGVVSLTKAGPVQPPCISGRPCGQPPHGPPVRGRPTAHARASAVPFARGHKWTSGVGASIRYDPQSWSAVEDTAEALELHMTDPTLLVRIVAVPAVSARPFNLLNAQLASAKDRYLGLVEDDEAGHELLEPLVGYVHGTGGMYRATANLPPSPGARVELAFEAATSGSATVLVRATTYQRARSEKEGFSSPFPVLETVDELLQTFEWGAARP